MMIMSLKEKKIKCRTIINLLKFLKLFFFSFLLVMFWLRITELFVIRRKIYCIVKKTTKLCWN